MSQTAERPLAEKAVLYCPNCSHESRVNGDWIIHVLDDSTVYECPDCGVTIESRHGRETFTEHDARLAEVSWRTSSS